MSRFLATALWGVFVLCVSSAALAQSRSPLMPEPETAFLRVIDTGPGTATLAIITGSTLSDRHVMIYDVGHWNDDYLIRDELDHYIVRGATVDLMIVGHSDSDHLGGSDMVLDYWNVRRSVRTGWEREDVGTYDSFRRALADAVARNGTEDFVIGDGSPALGETWQIGAASVSFLSGFRELPGDWDVGAPPGHSRHEAKARNAVGIVARLEFRERAILFPGDAVGRVDEADWNQLIGTEKFLVENAASRPIRADILLAPHHGADNASSLPFIEAVRPAWVIFSAGAKHAHLKFAAFRRYEEMGVPVAQILRTDRGDRKFRRSEWWGSWDDSCSDGHGDDGISILIRASGAITVDQDPVADPSKGC